MDKQKELLKNGFGSPGETARKFAEVYNTHFPNAYHKRDWETMFKELYNMREMTFKMMGLQGGHKYSSVRRKRIVHFSQGDLALFVFELMFIETSQFRNNIIANTGVFNLTTEVIHEEVIDNAPSTLMLYLDDFRNEARDFMSIYR